VRIALRTGRNQEAYEAFFRDISISIYHRAIPAIGQRAVAWIVDGVELAYARFEVTDIEYNVAG
jgi:hypothetical protein